MKTKVTHNEIFTDEVKDSIRLTSSSMDKFSSVTFPMYDQCHQANVCVCWWQLTLSNLNYEYPWSTQCCQCPKTTSYVICNLFSISFWYLRHGVCYLELREYRSSNESPQSPSEKWAPSFVIKVKILNRDLRH